MSSRNRSETYRPLFVLCCVPDTRMILFPGVRLAAHAFIRRTLPDFSQRDLYLVIAVYTDNYCITESVWVYPLP